MREIVEEHDEDEDIDILQSLTRPEVEKEARDDILFEILYHEDDEGVVEANRSVEGRSGSASEERKHSKMEAATEASALIDIGERKDLNADLRAHESQSNAEEGDNQSMASTEDSQTDEEDEECENVHDFQDHFVQFLPSIGTDRRWFDNKLQSGHGGVNTRASILADLIEDENLLFMPTKAAQMKSVSEANLPPMALPAAADTKSKSISKRPRIPLFGMQKNGQFIAVA
uniref:Uncharacterized protein n=1 Tax=Pseudictyota dubia TaxID=2749911 RepID=A0A7R9ZEJ7_9STRA